MRLGRSSEEGRAFPAATRPDRSHPEEAVGSVLAHPLVALADIPAYDTALHDGWAIAGPGPWRIRDARKRDIFAGLEYHEATTHQLLLDGQASPVTHGEALGSGVTGVISANRCTVDGELLKLVTSGRTPAATSNQEPGSDRAVPMLGTALDSSMLRRAVTRPSQR